MTEEQKKPILFGRIGGSNFDTVLKFIKRLLLFGSVVALLSMSPMFRLVKIDVEYLAEGKFPHHNDERIEFTGTITRIAHAGGMHHGRRYRNDMYALSANASNFTFLKSI